MENLDESFKSKVLLQLEELEHSAVAEEHSGVNFELSLPYCGRSLVFFVTCFQRGLDVTPVDVGLPSGVCFDVFTIGNCPCLSTWSPNMQKGLQALADQLTCAMLEYQTKLVENHPLKRYGSVQS